MNMENNFTFWVFSFLFFSFLTALLKFLHKAWWKPLQIQQVLRSQGIKGPPYVFLDGNTTEILERRRNSLSRRMLLSDDLLTTLQPHIYLWTRIYGKNFLHWPVATRPELVITEPELIQELLNDKEHCFARSEVDKHLKKILGEGILTSEGDKGEKFRNLSNQAFHDESLNSMIPSMVQSVEMMLGRWKKNYEGEEIDVSEEFRFLTAEIISRTAFGSSYVEGKQIFQMLRKLVILASKNPYKVSLSIIRMLFKDEDDLEAEKLEKGIRKFVSEIVKKRDFESRNGERHSFGDDFLGLLLKEHNDSDKITMEDVIEQCKVFYSAGQATIAVLLSWTILLLAIHGDWQEKAREEVINLFGQKTPSSEGISRLKTISMIINESLRLYPPTVYTERKTKKGAKLGKFILPENINIHVPILAIHRDPKIWGEDAHIFNPERFSNGVSTAAAFLPFSLGGRTCVGANFATIEAKITLSMILQRYAFTLSPNYIHSPTDIMSLRPQHGVRVILQAL